MAEGDDDINSGYGMAEQELYGDSITKSHYVPATDRSQCQNKSCASIFGYQNLRRPHHCHRCGEVFCRPCLKYRRRLNAMAQPDPLGSLWKVCLNCYDERVLHMGCTKRSRTEQFLELRHEARKERTYKQCDVMLHVHTQSGTIQPKFWKEQFKVDILKECRRLLDGFKSSFGTMENTLREIKKYVKVPEWQKSTFWALESDMVKCRFCGGKLGHRKKIRNCRVCGISLCKLCSYKELLLYFENGTRPGRHANPKMAIIKVIGSPEEEPDVAILVYCCYECRGEIIQRQIEDVNWYSQEPVTMDIEHEMFRMDCKFRNLTDTINTNMEKLSTLIDECEVSTVHFTSEENNNDKDDTELQANEDASKPTFEKLQRLKEGITLQLDSFWLLYDELKSVFKSCNKPQGHRLQLAINYFKAKKDFYVETKSRHSRMMRSFDVNNGVNPRPETIIDTRASEIFETEVNKSLLPEDSVEENAESRVNDDVIKYSLSTLSLISRN